MNYLSKGKLISALFLCLQLCIGDDFFDYQARGDPGHAHAKFGQNAGPAGPNSMFQTNEDKGELSPEDIAWVEAQKEKVMEMRRQGKSNLKMK